MSTVTYPTRRSPWRRLFNAIHVAYLRYRIWAAERDIEHMHSSIEHTRLQIGSHRKVVATWCERISLLNYRG